MLRWKGSIATMVHAPDRDVTMSLLRTAGHGNAVRRNVDLILSSKVKVDIEGRVVELTLGRREDQRWPAAQVHDDNNYNDVARYWDLPECVGNLTKLNKLTLSRCRSLPMSIILGLPNLHRLELHSCHGVSIVSFAENHRLHNELGVICKNVRSSIHKNITTLEIHGGVWNRYSMKEWLKRVVPVFTNTGEKFDSRLNLEEIRFSFLSSRILDAVLDHFMIIQTAKSGYNNTDNDDGGGNNEDKEEIKAPFLFHNLIRFAWTHSDMTNRHLERLLVEVVPSYSTLCSVDVSCNQIRSLQFLLAYSHYEGSSSSERGDRLQKQCGETKITTLSLNNKEESDNCKTSWQQACYNCSLKNGNYHPHYHKLRSLNLQHNPILKRRTSELRELQSFELLLRQFFPLLGSLTPNWEDWDPPIEYLLRINRGGRVLAEGYRMTAPFFGTITAKSRVVIDENGIVPNFLTDAKANNNSNGKYANKKKCSIQRITDSNNYDDVNDTNVVPLSLWPLILHNAYKTSSKGFLPLRNDVTALNHLIRNGPALLEIQRRVSSHDKIIP